MSMGESVILQDAWLLLKDFSFRRNLPEEYYNTLPERMVRHIESRRPLEHVEGAVHPHYADRKQERYNENQALPREFNTRAAKKYKFTLEDIMMFMANDVASQHPELKQVMNMQLPASDSRLPNRDPSMHFDAFQTSRPKATEHGLQHLMTPHFTINPRSGKLELKTVGSGGMSDKSRQSIHAKPTTSPIATDTHDNAKIHESLPQRFDFMEREVPSGQAVETASPIQPDKPQDPYAGLPPAFAEMMRQRDADNENKSEPMDIALRLLKNFVLEPDNPEQAYFQSSMGYHPETGKVGYVPNTEVDPLNDVRINLASPKQFMLRDRDGNPVDDGAGFDQFVQRVGKDLLHEHTHAAIDREIRQAYLDKILPSENVFSAHEVGAIAAQNPGEGFANQRGADRVSESETKHHPTTRDWRAEQSPFADGRWSPQPAYSSNSEEGYK